MAQAIGTKALNSNIFTKTRLSGKIRNEFEKTVELDSTNIQGRTGLINYYLRTPSFLGGDIKKAIEHAKFLKNQNEFRGRLALASIYQVQDKVDSAFVQFEHLENQYGDSPDHYYFYNNYGYFLLEQKQYDKAIEKFKKQIMLAPLQSNPYDSLGDAYEATGNLQEAIKAYQKALEIEPDIEITRKKLKDLERQSRR